MQITKNERLITIIETIKDHCEHKSFDHFYEDIKNFKKILLDEIPRVKDPKILEYFASVIDELEEALQPYVPNLTLFDQRFLLESEEQIRDHLVQHRAELIGRPKFNFSFNVKNEALEQEIAPANLPAFTPDALLHDLSDETLVYNVKEEEEIFIKDISSCDITIKGSTKALYLNGISNSKITIENCTGASLLNNLKNVDLTIKTHQFRMHESKSCNITLYSFTDPIIEDSEDLVFSALDGDNNKWDKIWDFSWIKNEDNPHYRLK